LREIKRAYRKLSVKYHPDKWGGSNEQFIPITKAYSALVDPEAKQNFLRYGHPDGP